MDVYGWDPKSIVSTPRMLVDVAYSHSGRILARRQIRQAAIADYSKLDPENKDLQLEAWSAVAGVKGLTQSFEDTLFYTGEVGEFVPEGVVVAENFEQVLAFFADEGLA